LIDDTVELASILSRALPTIDDYLDGFDETGALSEGVGYWNYGLGYFTMLVDLIDRRTNGAINIWSDERFRRAACFPLRCALTQTSFPSFSDCIRKVALWRPLLHVLAERLEIPELDSAAAQLPLDNGLSPESAATVVARDLFWGFPQSDSRSRLADYDWFPGVSWMIARAEPDNPAGLVLAVKAGHNGEMHNQNDVGSFLVEVGDEQLIADLGAGLYTKQYWSDSRYELFATSSRGHSVPEVDGREQKPGAESGARNVKPLLDGHSTGMSMDLSPAYPDECGLLSLDRTIRLNRDRTGGCVHLVDIAEFASSGSIASVLITRSDVALVNGMVIIQGSSRALHCVYDNSAVNVRIETVDNVALADGPTQVRRIVFQGRHGRISRIDVVITPDSSISAPTLTAHQERRAKTTCSLVAANSLPQE